MIVALPHDAADQLHRDLARPTGNLLVRLCRKLGVSAVAVAVSRTGSTTEIHCLFEDAEQATRVADALHAHAIDAGAWASCCKVALDEDTHKRALAIAGPAARRPGRPTLH